MLAELDELRADKSLLEKKNDTLNKVTNAIQVQLLANNAKRTSHGARMGY
jgi:hypothetical protein